MIDRLVALIAGTDAGTVTHDAKGKLALHYSEPWRQSRDSYPVSLSMPLVAAEHGHDIVMAFLSGLLPDNDRVLEAWGRTFGVSPRNPFRILEHVGEDLMGAVQFVVPDRVDELRSAHGGRVEWLTESDVAERLRTLGTDETAWRLSGDEGQFSLPGAQRKTALWLSDSRWGLPSGRTPTTHILKPAHPEFDGFPENEHICLELAAALGLPTANSRVMRFEDQVAIVVTRYDRVLDNGAIVRVHQEDVCQALGVPPTRKYENQQGPGIQRIVELLRENSDAPSEDVARFLDAMALNWILAGTDGHAKNYSILLGARSSVRLAPLYDVESALPYPTLNVHRIKLAMKVGGEYLVRRIGRRQWERLAGEVRVPADQLLGGVTRLAQEIPDQMVTVRRRAEKDGLRHPIVGQIETAIISRAQTCLEDLRRGRP